MNTLEILNHKILSGVELNYELYRTRFLNNKIVFTNGCFDLIHLGHIDYLSKAYELGDILIVGLNSDESVRKLKGVGRPVQNQETRAKILASFFFVSYVIVFNEDTPYRLINEVQPDILVKGGDYKPEDIAGYDIVTKKGGKVLTIPYLEGCSSTSIIEKLTRK
jgi:rfaE bifunctional protein nucleotidyltransferase chain/domain